MWLRGWRNLGKIAFLFTCFVWSVDLKGCVAAVRRGRSERGPETVRGIPVHIAALNDHSHSGRQVVSFLSHVVEKVKSYR